MIESEQAERVELARLRAVGSRGPAVAFFGKAIYHLQPVACAQTETAATDGARMYYNPAWIATLTDDELDAILLHEALHALLLHSSRLERNREQDAFRANLAADFEINCILRQVGYTLPAGCAEAKRAGLPPGLTAEEYFALLAAQSAQPPPPPAAENRLDTDAPLAAGSDSGEECSDGGDRAQTEDCASARNLSGIEVRQDLLPPAADSSAVSDRVLRGSIPSDVRDYLAKAIPNRVIDRRAVLRDALRDAIGGDQYSWRRLDRRLAGQGVSWPRRYGRFRSIVIAIDCSGSISDREAAIALAAINDLAAQGDYERIILLAHDVEPYWRGEIEPGTDVPEIPRSRGGTSHLWLPDYVEVTTDEISAVVCLTDLCTDFPHCWPYPFPLVWVALTASADPAPAHLGPTIYTENVE